MSWPPNFTPLVERGVNLQVASSFQSMIYFLKQDFKNKNKNPVSCVCFYLLLLFFKSLWDSRSVFRSVWVWGCWWVLGSQWHRKWPLYLETSSRESACFVRYLGLECHDWWVTIVSHGAIIVFLKKKNILTLVKRLRKTLFRTVVIDTKCHSRGERTGSTPAGWGVGGKLLRGGIKVRRILGEDRPRPYSSTVGDEEFD